MHCCAAFVFKFAMIVPWRLGPRKTRRDRRIGRRKRLHHFVVKRFCMQVGQALCFRLPITIFLGSMFSIRPDALDIEPHPVKPALRAQVQGFSIAPAPRQVVRMLGCDYCPEMFSFG